MKLTPLDIHHKEFRHSLRGYSEEEVDAFLDQVADEFERLFKENIDMAERLDSANDRVRAYQDMEKTLHNTMLAAQRSAEDIVGKAHEEAVMMLRDAEVKAKEIIHHALTSKQKIAGELVRIKHAEEDFRSRFASMLEGHLGSLKEITLPDDVSVLAGVTEEGIVAEVEVAAESALAALDEIMPEAGDLAVPESPFVSKLELDDADPGATQMMPPVTGGSEPPESGFVTGVMLGETDSPDDLPVDMEIREPREFPMVSFDSLGEREDDHDIEEID